MKILHKIKTIIFKLSKLFSYLPTIKISFPHKTTIESIDAIDLDGSVLRLKQEINRIKQLSNFKNNSLNLDELLKLEHIVINEFKLFSTILDSIEDMIWAKNIDGKYVLTNKSFRENFFYGLSNSEIIGKNDIELSKKFKQMVGAENHTFGEVCGDSDAVIIQNKKAQKFLEKGLIKGKMFKLMVNKTPVFQNNRLVAVAGSGKDVSGWHDLIENAIKDNSCFSGTKQLILDELNKYEFK